MTKTITSLILFLFLITSLKAQVIYNSKDATGGNSRQLPEFGNITIHVAFATYDDLLNETKMALDFAEVDTTAGQVYPVMFNLPDGQSVFNYFQNGGEPISYYDLWDMSIPSFFRDMTNDKLKITIEYIKNPDREDGLWILGSEVSHTDIYDAEDALNDSIQQKLNYASRLDQQDFPNSFVYKCTGCAWAGTDYTKTPFDNNINMALTTFSHELGHSLLELGDRGDYYGVTYYKGHIDGDFMGTCFVALDYVVLVYYNQMYNYYA